MAEEARLESVCTPKGYREFESRSLRKTMERQLVAKATGCFWFRARRKLAFVRGRNRKQTSGRQAAAAVPLSCKAPPGGHRDSDGPRPAESRPFAPSNATHWHTVNYDNMPAPNRTVNFLQLSLRQELPFDGLAHLMRSGHQGFSRLLPGWAPFSPHCGNARADFLFQKVMLPICRTEWKKPYLPTRILDYR